MSTTGGPADHRHAWQPDPDASVLMGDARWSLPGPGVDLRGSHGVQVILGSGSGVQKNYFAPQDVDQAAVRLASMVRAQWELEAGTRQVRPLPLKVRWSSTRRPVAAGRDVVMDDPARSSWRELPLRGNVEELVSEFRALPHRQLVVIGVPGSGKSVLAMLFTLGLLASAQVGEPVPVLVPLAGWNPVAEHLYDFMTRRLLQDYADAVGAGSKGIPVAKALITNGRILPVLDGLDEIPVDLHASALEAVNEVAATGRQMVITCRAKEYERAVETIGIELPQAAVVELEPVGVSDVIDFLSRHAMAVARWKPVFEHLAADPDRKAPLTRALSTPLMVDLARMAYRKPSTLPAKLLDLASQDAIEAYLVTHFVQAAYQERPRPQPGARRAAWRTHRSLRCTPEQATRWLSTLAYHLDQVGTADLAWWQISPGLLSLHPRRDRGLAAAAVVVLPPGVLALAVLPTAGVGAAVATLTVMTSVMILAVSGGFRALWPGGYPPSSRTWTPWRRRTVGLVFGTGCGIATTAMTATTLSVVPRQLGVALIAGSVIGVATSWLPTWPLRARSGRLRTPGAALGFTRRAGAVAAAQQAVIAAAVFAFVSTFVPGPGPPALAVAGAAAAVYACTAAMAAGIAAWSRYQLAHTFLAARQLLPWRLVSFLDDAHQHRGILRQTAATWQFRHLFLQVHLAPASRLAHLRAQVRAGDAGAIALAMGLLAQGSHAKETIALLESEVEAGTWHIPWHVVSRLALQGRVEEAATLTDKLITLLHARAESGDREAPFWLAVLLAEQGRTAELRFRAEAGDAWAAQSFDEVLAARGRTEDLAAGAEAGDRWAGMMLVNLLVEQGRVEELRARMNAGDELAAARVVDLLSEQGRTIEAVEVLQTRARMSAGQTSHQPETVPSTRRVGIEGPEEPWAGTDRGDRWGTRRLVDLLAQIPAEARDAWVDRWLVELSAQQGRVDGLEIALTSPGADWVEVSYRLVDLIAHQGRTEKLQDLACGHHSGYGSSISWRARWRMVDLLAAQGRLEALRELAESSSWGAARRLVGLFAEQGRIEELRACADAGDDWAGLLLVDLLVRQGRTRELRARVDVGDRRAAVRLSELLVEWGQADQGLALLRACADAGDELAGWRLADLLIKVGQVDEAITRLRTRADTGDQRAAERLVDLLAERGRIEELRVRADAGHTRAAWRLTELLARQGHLDQAITWLRKHADSGNEWAAEQLVERLAQQGCIDEVLARLEARAHAGDWRAGERLVELLVQHGRVDEAITRLWARVGSGDWRAGEQLVDVLAQQGRAHEAGLLLRRRLLRFGGPDWFDDLLAEQGQVEELRVRADGGNRRAAWHLADLLAQQDRTRELRGRADSGDRWAARRLAEVLGERGLVEELRARVDAGDEWAAWWLAEVLVGQGHTDEAITVLQPWADLGDRRAARRLAELLGERGLVEELRARADAGDEWAAWHLAEVLVGQGYTDEAITVLQPWADLGKRWAAGWFAELLAEGGRVEELRARAEEGDEWALARLAVVLARPCPPEQAEIVADVLHRVDLLDSHGGTDEAINVLQAQTVGGSTWAAVRLADLLAHRGRTEELRACVDSGDRASVSGWFATMCLVDLLARQGRTDELRAWAEAGERRAVVRLVDLLARQGRTDELQAWVDAGGRRSVVRLVDLLARQGRTDELRAWAEAGEQRAIWVLGQQLILQERPDEAITLIQRVAEASNTATAVRLAEVLAYQGHADEAITLLKTWAKVSDRRAADALIDLLAEQRHTTELQARSDTGDQRAACRLADLLARQNRIEELQARAHADDRWATMRLADLLTERHRVDEAEALLRTRADAGDGWAAERLLDTLTQRSDVG